MCKAFWVVGIAVAAHGYFVSPVAAQGVAQSEIVVPTFNVFSIGTTISVPDRGYTSLGGSHHASDVRHEFGPGFGRGFASRRVATDAGVRVWIHDFQEMEEALARGGSGDSTKPLGAFAARMYQYTSTPQPLNDSKEPVREDRLARSNADAKGEATFKQTHAADMLMRGQDAEGRGKLKVAALYYKSVVSLGVTPSAAVARDRLAAIETKIASR